MIILANCFFAFDCASLNALFGAGLGAAFYILLKTHKYLVQRTFDPRYNNAYLTRFVTGIVAGFILSIVIKFAVRDESAGALKNVFPGVVAILGGFSAEAVEQILQRMVEILVTTVRGDGAAQAKADAAVEKIITETERKKGLIEVREKLTEFKNMQGIANPADLEKAFKDILSRLK